MEYLENVLREYFPNGYMNIDGIYTAMYSSERFGPYNDALCLCICYDPRTDEYFMSYSMNNKDWPKVIIVDTLPDHIEIITENSDKFAHKFLRGPREVRKRGPIRHHAQSPVLIVPKKRLKINGAYPDVIIKISQ